MAKYFLTRKAVDDLTGIWNYTCQKWSEKQADKYYGILIETYQKIADDPELGRSFDEIGADLKGLRILRHIIFYREIEKGPVAVIRILNGRMDLRKHISEGN